MIFVTATLGNEYRQEEGHGWRVGVDGGSIPFAKTMRMKRVGRR